MEAPFLDISSYSIWQRIGLLLFFLTALVFPSPEVKISALSGMKERRVWKGSLKIKLASVSPRCQERGDRAPVVRRWDEDSGYHCLTGPQRQQTQMPFSWWWGAEEVSASPVMSANQETPLQTSSSLRCCWNILCTWPLILCKGDRICTSLLLGNE